MDMNNPLLAMISVAIVLTAGACAPQRPEPIEPAPPTSTTAPTVTPQPTVQTNEVGETEESDSPELTEADMAYMQWLAGLHGEFQRASEGLIDGWQASEAQGAGEVAAETVEEMESLTAMLEDYAQEVQAREDVPGRVTDVHAALLDQVAHWETAAPLLLESVDALAEGDQAAFQEKGEEAVKEIDAAVDARAELLAAASELLAMLQAEDGS